MTVYQRFRRWSEAGIWEAVATTLARAMADNSRHSLDSTTVRGHVSAAGAKGGLANKLLAVRGPGSPLKFIVSVMPEASRSSSTSRPRLSGSVVLRGKPTQIRRLLPLTLPLRGSLPLPARGETAGVRGDFCTRRLTLLTPGRWPGASNNRFR